MEVYNNSDTPYIPAWYNDYILDICIDSINKFYDNEIKEKINGICQISGSSETELSSVEITQIIKRIYKHYNDHSNRYEDYYYYMDYKFYDLSKRLSNKNMRKSVYFKIHHTLNCIIDERKVEFYNEIKNVLDTRMISKDDYDDIVINIFNIVIDNIDKGRLDTKKNRICFKHKNKKIVNEQLNTYRKLAEYKYYNFNNSNSESHVLDKILKLTGAALPIVTVLGGSLSSIVKQIRIDNLAKELLIPNNFIKYNYWTAFFLIVFGLISVILYLIPTLISNPNDGDSGSAFLLAVYFFIYLLIIGIYIFAISNFTVIELISYVLLYLFISLIISVGFYNSFFIRWRKIKFKSIKLYEKYKNKKGLFIASVVFYIMIFVLFIFKIMSVSNAPNDFYLLRDDNRKIDKVVFGEDENFYVVKDVIYNIDTDEYVNYNPSFDIIEKNEANKKYLFINTKYSAKNKEGKHYFVFKINNNYLNKTN